MFERNEGSQNSEVPKSKGGSPGKWNWEQGIIDAWAAIYAGEVPMPEKIADVTALLQKKMDQTGDGGPSQTEAKKRARRIFRALKLTE